MNVVLSSGVVFLFLFFYFFVYLFDFNGSTETLPKL